MAARSVRSLIEALNPEQQQAVLCTDGPLLVLAGAGTGKTRVVTVRIAHLLDRGVSSERILAVTFTNKAAAEMKQRVTEFVGKSAAKGLTITTFHSFAIRVLKEFGERLGFPPNFTIADDEDRKLLIRTTLREMGIAESQVAPSWALSQISAWKNEGIDAEASFDEAVDEREILVAHAYAGIAKEMVRRQIIDFDDMIMLTAKLFREHPDVLDSCRDRYHYLMVDEYQDTNRVQDELVSAIAGPRRNLCVVGDDDQSIYGWRGARPGNILGFAKRHRGTKVVKLTQNYRSTNKILNLANAVIANNTSRLDKNLWSALGDGDDVVFFRAQDEREEILRFVGRLLDLQRRGIPLESVAVLFRAKTQSNALELALRERSIPYRIVGTRSLFDRRECRDLLAYLKLLVNPKDDGALTRILNTPTRGIGRGSRDKLMALAVEKRCSLLEVILEGDLGDSLRGKAAESVAEFGRLMADLSSCSTKDGLTAALEMLLERSAYQAWLDMDANDGLEATTRWNVVRQFVELAESYESRGGPPGAAGFLEALALDEQRDRRKDGDGTGISLLTVHAAKGLEFDQVFIVGVEEGIFPHKNSFENDEGLDSIDEERRLFYVAVTRARRGLEFTMASKRRRYGRDEDRQESRFVEEMGEEGLVFTDAASEEPADDRTTDDYIGRLKSMFGS